MQSEGSCCSLSSSRASENVVFWGLRYGAVKWPRARAGCHGSAYYHAKGLHEGQGRMQRRSLPPKACGHLLRRTTRKTSQRELVRTVICSYNREEEAAISDPLSIPFESDSRGGVLDSSSKDRAPPKPLHEIGDVVNARYKISGVLGQGGLGTMYEAEVIGGEGKIALKALSLRGMKGWKDLELFEREARVLRSLTHPSIAEYVDSFEVDSDQDRTYYIAQRVAQGKSLSELVKGGLRLGESEVVDIALQVLGVLEYLENLRPPVVHRDIKPENIIVDLDSEGKGSRKVTVVDFGAVAESAAATLFGSTVVGTYGYMAPEQFRGEVTPQSDLYALGGTMLFMLSGRPPSDFPQERLKVSFRERVRVSARLADLLERLLEPAVEDRFRSALEVTRALRGEDEQVMSSMSPDKWRLFLASQRPSRLRKPAGSKVEVERSGSEFVVCVPPAGLTAETVGRGTFAVAWNAFIALWTGSAIAGGAPILFTLFSLPFWFVGIRLAKSALSGTTVSTTLELTRRNFSINWKVAGIWSHSVEGRIEDLSAVQVVLEGTQNGEAITSVQLTEGVKRHSFGGGLTPVEKDWLAGEIADFLTQVNPGYRPTPFGSQDSGRQVGPSQQGNNFPDDWWNGDE